MFTINDDYNNEELNFGGAIRKSGVYMMKCTRAKIFKSANSSSEALGLTFEDKDEQKAWFNIWYKNKNGEDVKFATRHINHLLALCKITKDNLNWDKDGNVVSLINKYVGVIVEVGKGLDYNDNSKEVYEYKFQGFYDYNTNKTIKELRDNAPAVIVNKMIEKYKGSEEVVLNNSNSSSKHNDMGMTETFDSDLPF